MLLAAVEVAQVTSVELRRTISAAATLEDMRDGPDGAEAGTNSASLGGRPAGRAGKGSDPQKPAGKRRQRAFRLALVRVVTQVWLA